MTPQLLVSLSPWIVFIGATRAFDGDRDLAIALLSLALSSYLLGSRLARGFSPTWLDIAGVGTFAACSLIAALDIPDRHFNGSSALTPILATASLAVVMMVSAATVPFTEQIARITTPRAYWSSPVFRAVQARRSLYWGLGTLVSSLALFAIAR